jgi:4-oxalocrotonate tautomerase
VTSRRRCPELPARAVSPINGRRGTHREKGQAMPYVNIQITRGATRQQKANLVRDVTDSLVRELGKRPDHIHVVIQEIELENWGFSGMLTDEYRQLHEQGGPHDR